MVFAGTSHPELGEEVATGIGVSLGGVEVSNFSNGEIYVRFLESVRGVAAFVIPTCSEPISAHLVADIITAAGANRVLSIDLHAGQIQGFFDFPLDHITAMPLLASYIVQKNLSDMVVVSPDAGRVKVSKRLSDKLHVPMAIMHKRRPEKNVAEILHVIGEVEGKTAILIDDMVDTAGTMAEAADALKKHGATEIYACATHAILSGNAVERIALSEIKELVVTNTLPVPPEKKIDKITVLSIAPLLANNITAVFKEESVSEIAGADNQT